MTVSVTENWMRALNAIADELKVQRLEDMGADVRVQSKPFDAKDARPGVYVTPTDVRNGGGRWGGTNERDYRQYGCQVTVVRGGTQSRGASPARETGWHEVLNRLFHKQRLNMTPHDGDVMMPCYVEDAPLVDPEIAQRMQQLDATAKVVRVWIGETRT